MTKIKQIIFPIFILMVIASYGNKNSNKENKPKAIMELYEPEYSTPREQCPCCDYFSLPEQGNYLICPICFWEDDGQDVGELDVSSGPNHGITLREGRANFTEFGACEKKMVKHVISVEERKKFKREIRNLEEN